MEVVEARTSPAMAATAAGSRPASAPGSTMRDTHRSSLSLSAWSSSDSSGGSSSPLPFFLVGGGLAAGAGGWAPEDTMVGGGRGWGVGTGARRGVTARGARAPLSPPPPNTRPRAMARARVYYMALSISNQAG